MFLDEMLELFKGQLTYEELTTKLTYKEALTLRDVRVERLQKEREELEKEREKENQKIQQQQARDKIVHAKR
jgi:F0F1-type ATP synthase epsilon subunit